MSQPQTCGPPILPTTRPTPGVIPTSFSRLTRSRRLEEEGVIGELADRAFTFMGGIYSTRKVRETLAPQLTEQLKAERVDVALLVPV